MPKSSPLTVQELQKKGLLGELARVFSDRALAQSLLFRIDFPQEHTPSFDVPRDFWFEICNAVANGLTYGGLEALLSAAAELFPYNSRFKPWRKSTSRSAPKSTRGQRNQKAAAGLGERLDRIAQALTAQFTKELEPSRSPNW